MVDSTGLCNICNKPSPNLNSCRLCGSKVCPQHYDSAKGICTNCKQTPQELRKIKK